MSNNSNRHNPHRQSSGGVPTGNHSQQHVNPPRSPDARNLMFGSSDATPDDAIPSNNSRRVSNEPYSSSNIHQPPRGNVNGNGSMQEVNTFGSQTTSGHRNSQRINPTPNPPGNSPPPTNSILILGDEDDSDGTRVPIIAGPAMGPLMPVQQSIVQVLAPPMRDPIQGCPGMQMPFNPVDDGASTLPSQEAPRHENAPTNMTPIEDRSYQTSVLYGHYPNNDLPVAPLILAAVPVEFNDDTPPPVVYWRTTPNGKTEMPIVVLAQLNPPALSHDLAGVLSFWEDSTKKYRECKRAAHDLGEQVSSMDKELDDLMLEKNHYLKQYQEMSQRYGTTSVLFADAPDCEWLTQTFGSWRHISPPPERSKHARSTLLSANRRLQVKTPEESDFGDIQKLKLTPAVEKLENVPEKSKEGCETITNESGKPASEAPTAPNVVDANIHVEPESSSEVASQDTHEKAAKTWNSSLIAEPSRTVNTSDTPSSSSQTHASTAPIESPSRILDDGFKTPKLKKIATTPSKLMSAHMENAQRLSRLQSRNSQPEKLSDLQELVKEESSDLKEESAVKTKTVRQKKEDVARSRGSDKALESSSLASHSEVASAKKKKDGGAEKKTSVVLDSSSILQKDPPEQDGAVVPIKTLSDSSSKAETPILQSSGPLKKVVQKASISSISDFKKESTLVESKLKAEEKTSTVPHLDLLTPSKKLLVDQMDTSSPSNQNQSSSNSFQPHLTAHSPRGSEEYNGEKQRLQKLIDGYLVKIRIPLFSRLAFQKERRSLHPCHDKIIAYWQKRFSYDVKGQRNKAQIIPSMGNAIKRRRECKENEFSPTIVVLLDLLMLQTDEVIIMDTIFLYADHNTDLQPQREEAYLVMLEDSANWTFDPSDELTPVGPRDLDGLSDHLSNPQLASCRQYINRQFSLRFKLPNPLLVNGSEAPLEKKVRMVYQSSIDTNNWTKGDLKTTLKVRYNTASMNQRIDGGDKSVMKKLELLKGINSSILDFDTMLYATVLKNKMLPEELYPIREENQFLSLFFS